MARQRSAKPSTAVRIRSRPQFKIFIYTIMAVTRLKRKDRRNKTVSRLEVQFLKNATNIENGTRSLEPKHSQVVKNNAILTELSKA